MPYTIPSPARIFRISLTILLPGVVHSERLDLGRAGHLLEDRREVLSDHLDLLTGDDVVALPHLDEALEPIAELFRCHGPHLRSAGRGG